MRADLRLGGTTDECARAMASTDRRCRRPFPRLVTACCTQLPRTRIPLTTLDDVIYWLFALSFAMAVGLAVGNMGAYVRIRVARYLERK